MDSTVDFDELDELMTMNNNGFGLDLVDFYQPSSPPSINQDGELYCLVYGQKTQFIQKAVLTEYEANELIDQLEDEPQLV